MSKFSNILLVSAACLSVAISGCGGAENQAGPQPASEWSQHAINDLNVAHGIMMENHPGPKDVDNPNFTTQADASLSNALSIAQNVTDKAGYGAALLAYTAGFRDGHFGVFAKRGNGDDVQEYWPGLIPAWRADMVKISHAEPQHSDLLGAQILSCDNTPISDVIRDQVFQFDSGKPDQVSYWARRTPTLFIYANNPAAPRLKACTFKLTTGETVTRDLNWETLTNDVWSHARAAAFGTAPDTGMKEVSPKSFWINLPDFNPDEDGMAANRALFAQVKNRRTELRDAKSIIIDMRGNQGGSSAWGGDMIEALWGTDYPDSRRPADTTYVDWRLSDGNVAHMNFIVEFLIEAGKDELANDYFRPIYEGAKKAQAAGQVFYTEDSHDEITKDPAADKASVSNPVKTPVYLLTHGTCVSACLDFADALFQLEGVTHIGYPTGSDTNYMEIRQEDLPSGLGVIAIPTKVYRNRGRAAGAYYTPDIQYDGFDWSDAAVESWALEAISK